MEEEEEEELRNREREYGDKSQSIGREKQRSFSLSVLLGCLILFFPLGKLFVCGEDSKRKLKKKN